MILRPLVILVPLAQVAVLLWVIWLHTPQLPWADEWMTVQLVKHANEGTLTLAEIWALHNGAHRIVTTRLLDLALIELTRWNCQIEMTVDLGFAVGSLALIGASVRRSLRSWNALLALLPVISLLLLSFSQQANWFYPFQVQFILTMLGVAVTMRALIEQPVGWRGFILALCGAVLATLSSAAGLVLWIAFLPSLYRMGYRWLAGWTICGLVAWVAYLIGMPQTPRPSIIHAVEYTLTFLGGPLSETSIAGAQLVTMAGLALLVVNLYVYWRLRGELWSVLVWIDLALFGLGVAAITSSSRGVDYATSSRYQIFGAFWWLAPVVLSALVIQQIVRRWRAGTPLPHGLRLLDLDPALVVRSVLGVNVVALVLVAVLGLAVNRVGLIEGVAFQDMLRRNEACLVNEQIPSDSCIQTWYSLTYKQVTIDGLNYLKQHHLAIFADPGTR